MFPGQSGWQSNMQVASVALGGCQIPVGSCCAPTACMHQINLQLSDPLAALPPCHPPSQNPAFPLQTHHPLADVALGARCPLQRPPGALFNPSSSSPPFPPPLLSLHPRRIHSLADIALGARCPLQCPVVAKVHVLEHPGVVLLNPLKCGLLDRVLPAGHDLKVTCRCQAVQGLCSTCEKCTRWHWRIHQ